MKITNLDQLLAMMGAQGAFRADALQGNEDLIEDLYVHAEEYRKRAKGTITIKISYTVDYDGSVEVAGTFEAKRPKQPPAKTVLWVDQGRRHLTAENPNQAVMDFAQQGRSRASREIVDVSHTRAIAED